MLGDLRRERLPARDLDRRDVPDGGAGNSEGEQGVADKDWDSFVCMFILDGGVAEYQLGMRRSRRMP